jgi:hypothetical protein
MEQRDLNFFENNHSNIKITFHLETSGGQNFNLFLNAVYFFNASSKLDIYGSIRQLFSCIGI